ncbi:amidase family protein [Streptomyces sp. NPDC056656]|uniref:amidase family protein n=1 Tax=Streptomyces sp. NPDC056656 TaxID=3345895 RepID=UPI0036A31F2E
MGRLGGSHGAELRGIRPRPDGRDATTPTAPAGPVGPASPASPAPEGNSRDAFTDRPVHARRRTRRVRRSGEGHVGRDLPDDPEALRNSYPTGVFTSVFNVTGQPAISLPIHHDAATGLPVGVRIVAAPWREDPLLQVSRTLELALPWAGRHPPVS